MPTTDPGPKLTLQLQTLQEPPDNGGAFVPDDPDYRYDPTYRGKDALDYWQAHLGQIQPQQALMAQNALIRLHVWCRRSPREILALVEHVAKDRKAREWWGTGKSPSTWLRTKDQESQEQTWQVIRAHWMSAGGKLAKTEPTRAEVIAKSQYQPLPEPPPWDRDCPGVGRGCKRGFVRDGNGSRVPCPECARGQWHRQWNTRPETLAAMVLE